MWMFDKNGNEINIGDYVKYDGDILRIVSWEWTPPSRIKYPKLRIVLVHGNNPPIKASLDHVSKVSNEIAMIYILEND